MKPTLAVVVLLFALTLPSSFFASSNAVRAEGPCISGLSAGLFPCSRIRLQSQIPLGSFRTLPRYASSLWGYVDPDDNREYAIIGLSNGTAVVDVTDPVNPRIVRVVPGLESRWREVKTFSVFNNRTQKWDGYAYVVSEAENAGIQILNLSQLPNRVSLVRVDRDISTAHTLFVSNIDFATAVTKPGLQSFLYLAGTNRSSFQRLHGEDPGRGLTVFNLTNPKNPVIVGNYDESYVHDVFIESFTDPKASQCAPGHNPCEVVFAWTGSEGLRILDFTEKNAPVLLSSLIYNNLGYAHSGWISKNKKWLFNFDELDEMFTSTNTRILSINISNLRNPRVRATWRGSTRSIEHNGFVVGNKLYVAHYSRGLVIFNVTNPARIRQSAYFDTHPENDITDFTGAWNAYPFLPSGNILISDIERGLFILQEE